MPDERGPVRHRHTGGCTPDRFCFNEPAPRDPHRTFDEVSGAC
ncbi:hypothetical protein [Streptomyces sp. NPDC002088]